MKITKKQLQNIIREYTDITQTQLKMPPPKAEIINALEIVFYNLDDMLSGLVVDDLIDEIEMNKELLANLVYQLGGQRLS
jgi:hypothetical protein